MSLLINNIKPGLCLQPSFIQTCLQNTHQQGTSVVTRGGDVPKSRSRHVPCEVWPHSAQLGCTSKDQGITVDSTEELSRFWTSPLQKAGKRNDISRPIPNRKP